MKSHHWQIPMAPDADHSQQKADNHPGQRRNGLGQPARSTHDYDDRSRKRGGCVHISPQDRRNLRQKNIADRASANTGDTSHQDRNEGMDAELQRLLSSGNSEKA